MYDPPVRFEVGILRDAGKTGAVIRALTGVSERTQRRVAKEGLPMWQMSKEELVRERGIGRPSVLDELVRQEIDRMLSDAPDVQVSEVLRRLRSDVGYLFGKTPVYEYVRANRPKKQQLPVVCFEGVAGEFAQHDFGEQVLRYDDGVRENVHFYAGRLKYSRHMHVKICENQQIESVIRGMLSFADEVGGMALVNVWDRPKTVVTGVAADVASGVVRPVFNAQFAQFIKECGVVAELCAPASGNQKGTVENLVKFVKHGFFLARHFRNRADMLCQLGEWLEYVNRVRPCSATGQIPGDRLERERERLRALPFSADTYGIFHLRTVGSRARVSLAGLEYSVGAEWISQNVEVRVFPERVRVSYAGKSVEHARFPENGKYSVLPEHRGELFVKPRGAIMAKRQMLMDLCPEGEAFFTELVHPDSYRGMARD